jgi:hypothetical protein
MFNKNQSITIDGNISKDSTELLLVNFKISIWNIGRTTSPEKNL